MFKGRKARPKTKKGQVGARLPDSLLPVGFGYLATGAVVFFGEVYPKIQPGLGYVEATIIEVVAVFQFFLSWGATKSRRPGLSFSSPFFRDVGFSYLPAGLIGFLGTRAHGSIVLAVGLTMILLGVTFIIIGGRRSGIGLKDLRLLFDPKVYRLP